MKDVQATGEAFRLQKRRFRTSGDEFSSFFLLFRDLFALLNPDQDPHSHRDPDPADQNQCGSLRIWIHNTVIIPNNMYRYPADIFVLISRYLLYPTKAGTSITAFFYYRLLKLPSYLHRRTGMRNRHPTRIQPVQIRLRITVRKFFSSKYKT